jgi:hypothetical protein
MNKPTSPFEARLRQVDQFMPIAEIRMQDIPPEGLELASLICKSFQIGYGTLLRRAFAIQLADGHTGILRADSMQEAARHCVAQKEPDGSES